MGWIILIVILLVIVLGVRIVPQSTAKVIERLGSYHTTMQTGVHYVIPFIDRVANCEYCHSSSKYFQEWFLDL